MSELERARRDAAELARLRASAERLPQLEAEEAERRRLDAAAARAAELKAELDRALAAFRADKSQSDKQIADLLAQARTVIGRRLGLGEQAGAVHNLAWRLATAERLARPGVDVAAPAWQIEGDVRGAAEQHLINAGYAGGALLHFREPGNEIEAAVLVAIAGITGDAVTPGPAAAADVGGRVRVHVYNERANEYEWRWQ